MLVLGHYIPHIPTVALALRSGVSHMAIGNAEQLDTVQSAPCFVSSVPGLININLKFLEGIADARRPTGFVTTSAISVVNSPMSPKLIRLFIRLLTLPPGTAKIMLHPRRVQNQSGAHVLGVKTRRTIVLDRFAASGQSPFPVAPHRSICRDSFDLLSMQCIHYYPGTLFARTSLGTIGCSMVFRKHIHIL